jgi:TolB-like protein/tetratricopeptide (TPR) repeat protein
VRSLLLVLVASVAQAAPAPTVAVMPFVDLSGHGRSVGEAIRETVTTELRAVAGLRVVERARLDGVLGEQSLQARGDLDVPRAVAVGKLVGATLIATGAYQRVGDEVRLTARFVSVESGVVVGSAKVDGAAGDFLALQDRVTQELARSAGFALPARRRPRLGSGGMRGVELYGDALLARDDERRHELLRQAIAVEPQLEYAVHDLDALERRMQEYAARAEHERERLGLARVAQLAARVPQARDDAARVASYEALFDELQSQHRFRRLADETRAVVDHPPVAPSTRLGARLDEDARWLVILTLSILKSDTDRVLRDGERFLALYPTSRFFDDVKQVMSYAIRKKRKEESGEREALARIEALPAERRADPCAVGHIYHEERQLERAAAFYERCVADPRRDQSYLENLVTVYMAMADFKSARRALGLLRVRYPGLAEQPQHQGWREMPIDAD